MPLPTFTQPASIAAGSAPPAVLNRTQIAARLGLNGQSVDKLRRAGILSTPTMTDEVDRLAHGREHLRVTSGELTVLRTDARAKVVQDTAPEDPRRWVGFHVEHSDEELADTSLRWWLCDPERVVRNELFAVTVATFPVAVYRITGKDRSVVACGETRPRHAFSALLLARIHPSIPPTFTSGRLRPLAAQIMQSRIEVASGGPIGYLN